MAARYGLRPNERTRRSVTVGWHDRGVGGHDAGMNRILRTFATALPVLLLHCCAGAPETTSPSPSPAAPETKPKATASMDEMEPQARPGLGFMPDYQADVRGVRVGGVRDGSPADLAGLEEGDVLIELAGIAVEDAQSYTEVLDEQRIGSTVPLKVRRGDQVVELQVKVGTRRR